MKTTIATIALSLALVGPAAAAIIKPDHGPAWACRTMGMTEHWYRTKKLPGGQAELERIIAEVPDSDCRFIAAATPISIVTDAPANIMTCVTDKDTKPGQGCFWILTFFVAP